MVTTNALLSCLELESVAPEHYRGGHVDFGHGVVSGGQLLGQALVAAARWQPGKLAKTIHTVFARAASCEMPIEIEVHPIQAGRAFASANVVASQAGRVCAQSIILLTSDEPDLIRHGDSVSAPQPPADVADDGTWQVRVEGGIDLSDPELVGPPDVDVWVRFAGAAIEPRLDPVIDQALVAFSTDFFLIAAAMRPHPGVGQAQAHKTLSTGVISHTLTFHEPTPGGAWTLLRHHSSYAGRGRSYGRGDVFSADGTLAASFVQDAMIRPMASSGGSL